MKKLSDYRAIVLDRDGVINHDSAEYIKSAEEWLPIAGSIDAVVKLKQRGLIVCVCSNQSGVGRGFFDLPALRSMHNKLHGLLAEKNTVIDRLYFCPHHPDDLCSCRKPGIAMLQMVAQDFDVMPEQILFVGDTKSDYQCARQFGCDFALVLSGKGQAHRDRVGADVAQFPDLAALVQTL